MLYSNSFCLPIIYINTAIEFHAVVCVRNSMLSISLANCIPLSTEVPQKQRIMLAGTLFLDVVQKESDPMKSQGKPKRVMLWAQVGCQVCSGREKEENFHNFAVDHIQSCSSHHIVLLWHTRSGFLWSFPFPLIQNILSHLLFLPAVSPLLPATSLIMFTPWMRHKK